MLFQKLRKTGTVDRPRSARMEENMDLVDDLIVSQKDKPQTHRTVWEIASETRIPRSSVVRIIKKDLRLKCLQSHTTLSEKDTVPSRTHRIVSKIN